MTEHTAAPDVRFAVAAVQSAHARSQLALNRHLALRVTLSLLVVATNSATRGSDTIAQPVYIVSTVTITASLNTHCAPLDHCVHCMHARTDGLCGTYRALWCK
jgi:hypothetical protein